MGAGASAQFGPALDACAAKPADGSDLRDFNTAKAEAVQLRRTLAALRYQVNAQGQGASACFEHLHDGMQQWTRYSPEQSCLIATALAGNPDAVIQLPGLPFSVRCGRNATAQGMPVPPDSGLLQVNNNSGACRIVRVALGHGAGLRAEDGFWHFPAAHAGAKRAHRVGRRHGAARRRQGRGPGLRDPLGYECYDADVPAAAAHGLIFVGPRGGSTVIRGQWGPLPVFAGPRGRACPQRTAAARRPGGTCPPRAATRSPAAAGPASWAPCRASGRAASCRARRLGARRRASSRAPPVQKEGQASGGGGLGVGGAVAAGVVGGAVGAGVVMAAANPGAIVDGANAASQWAGQNIASDAQVIGAANDVAQWTGRRRATTSRSGRPLQGRRTVGLERRRAWDQQRRTGRRTMGLERCRAWDQHTPPGRWVAPFKHAGDWTAGAAGTAGRRGRRERQTDVAGDWTAGAAMCDSGARQAIDGFANVAGGGIVNAADATGDAFAVAGDWAAGAAVDSGQAIGGFAVDAGQAIGGVGGDVGSAIGDVAGAIGSALGFYTFRDSFLRTSPFDVSKMRCSSPQFASFRNNYPPSSCRRCPSPTTTAAVVPEPELLLLLLSSSSSSSSSSSAISSSDGSAATSKGHRLDGRPAGRRARRRRRAL